MQNVSPEASTPANDAKANADLKRVLAEQGVVAALRVMNRRAPHRYTGIFKYTPSILENVHLVDAFDPAITKGADVATEDAYCVLLPEEGRAAFGRPEEAPFPVRHASPVVSYCGVLLVRANGEPLGSLCHYDVARCQEPAAQMPFLAEIAPYIAAELEAAGH